MKKSTTLCNLKTEVPTRRFPSDKTKVESHANYLSNSLSPTWFLKYYEHPKVDIFNDVILKTWRPVNFPTIDFPNIS